jgi:putative ABC transport system permease protein
MSSSNRRVIRGSSLDTVWHDLRLAVRALHRSPTLASTIVLTLALGIGANAAIFAVVNSLLLRPLPVADPDRLMTISFDSAIARGNTAGFGWSFAMWENLQPHASLFDGVIAWTPARFDLARSGERQPVEGIFTSPGYFDVLGVPAVRGRTFTAADDRPGGGANGPVAVISNGLWQRRFGGAEVIGAPLVVDGVSVTIVGVTPPGFFGIDVGRAFDVALPLQTEPLIHGSRSTLRTSPLLVMLRVRRDQSVEAGTAALRAIQPQILGVTADGMSSVRPAHHREPFTLVSAATGTSLPVRGPSGLRQTYARPLLTILAVVLLVLLIACVNLANLLLARASVRRYELGVRLALGARRGRLVRQLLIESLVLAVLGAIGALLIAAWGSQALVAQLSTPANRIMIDLSLDWRVLAFTATTAVATAAIFGTVPAFRATQMDPIDVLRLEGRGRSHDDGGTRRFVTLSGSLVITQIALSLALVVAAGLLVRSFARLSHVPLGFDPDRVLVVNVDTERARPPSADRLPLFQQIVDAAAAAPGVVHAGGSIWTPVDGGMRMGDSQSRVAFNFVTPGWFAAYGTAVRLGRDFTVQDTIAAAPVVIVNEAFVHAIMQDRFPLGEAIPYPRSRRGEVRRTIVGVVADAIFDSQREGTQAIVYLPVAQSEAIGPGGVTEISIGVRPAVGTPMQLARSVGAAISSVDPSLSFSFRALTDHVQASRRQERIVAMLSGFFGTLALLIAALGLYGMASYAASQRFREIGIRMALGARPGNVLRLVLQQIATLTVAGIVLGLAGAAAVTRYVRSLLFDLTPLDPSTFIGVGALFVVVAVLAASIPAVRATRVEPLVALRTE